MWLATILTPDRQQMADVDQRQEQKNPDNTGNTQKLEYIISLGSDLLFSHPFAQGDYDLAPVEGGQWDEVCYGQ